jgi:integrating conjugative element protein (TIGR03761 family)
MNATAIPAVELPRPGETQSAPATTAAGPGALKGEAWISLHTRDAHRLAMGRRATEERNRIVGLPGFGYQVATIWLCARADDPYANWWLIRIEEKLEATRQALQALREDLEGRLRGHEDLHVELSRSTEPLRMPLRFANPFANAAAVVVTEADKAILALLTARHYGLLGREDFGRLRQQVGHQVRSLLSSAEGWRNAGVGREDFRQGTAKAAAARKALGELPEAVLNGTRRAAMAPEIARLGGQRANPFSALRVGVDKADVETGTEAAADGQGEADEAESAAESETAQEGVEG